MTALSAKFSVAPMIDWTDRHCRFFHRLLTRKAVLYTEMIVADAIIHGNRDYLLGFDDNEHPNVLQLGGSDPAKLAEAARIGEGFGYDAINLNIGCPSDRVQSGAFGACLMQEPDLVSNCITAMKEAVSCPVTVKCRIGVDEQIPSQVLPDFIERVANGGATTFIIHARKAWLQGLSPKENRTIPPLEYSLVHAMKGRFPKLEIIINGGITSIAQCQEQLSLVDGVMMGRAAYETPWILSQIDKELFGISSPPLTRRQVVKDMENYLEQQLQQGVRVHNVTRHMLGLFHGCPGARRWRQILAMEAIKPEAKPNLLQTALNEMPQEILDQAA
jgi:tRNA-dihydrouridine synthase A